MGTWQEIEELIEKFDPNQPRDAHGRWSKYGGGAIVGDKKVQGKLNSSVKAMKQRHATQGLGSVEDSAGEGAKETVGKWLGAWGPDREKIAEGLLSEKGGEVEKRIYAFTQTRMEAMGETHVVVYRGVHGKYADELADPLFGKKANDTVTIGVNSLSAWSASKEVAIEFAGAKDGVVLQMKVPRRHVFLQMEHTNSYRAEGAQGFMRREKEIIVVAPTKTITLNVGDIGYIELGKVRPFHND